MKIRGYILFFMGLVLIFFSAFVFIVQRFGVLDTDSESLTCDCNEIKVRDNMNIDNNSVIAKKKTSLDNAMNNIDNLLINRIDEDYILELNNDSTDDMFYVLDVYIDGELYAKAYAEIYGEEVYLKYED